jgi:hypothetical protein
MEREGEDDDFVVAPSGLLARVSSARISSGVIATLRN